MDFMDDSLDSKANKQKLLDYLKERKQMVLATFGELPWACTVYYFVDDEFNLYFMSTTDTQHCRDIGRNPKVACVIADTGQEFTDKKIGVQLRGKVEQVGMLGSAKVLATMFKVLRPSAGELLSFENFKKSVIERRAFKIRPERIKFFNEEIYGEFGREFFEFE